jgi:hypothetical protein
MTTGTIEDQTMELLILYLLEWLDARDQTYEEVMEAWHTSRPHLPVWEEANKRAFVTLDLSNGSEVVRLTSNGTAVLQKHRFLEIMRDNLKVVS